MQSEGIDFVISAGVKVLPVWSRFTVSVLMCSLKRQCDPFEMR